MSHFSHDRRNLRREASGRQPLPFGRNRRRVLRLPRRDGRSARLRDSRERRPAEAAKRASARPVVAESEPLELSAALPGAPPVSAPPWRSPPPRRSRRSAASCSRPRPARPARPGRPAAARNAARASGKRSRCPITAPASRLSRRSCARGSAGSERPSSSSRRSAIGRGAEESQYGRARADGRAGVRGADPRDRR